MAAPSRSAAFAARARRSHLLRLLLVALAYVALARLGVAMAYHREDASLVWPAHGLAVAALLLWGVRMWPGIALAAFASGLLSGAPAPSAAVVAAANALGPVLGILLLRRVDFRIDLARPRDAAALLLLGGALSATVSASVGIATLALRGVYPADAVLTPWAVWWTGDMTGLVTVTPALLVWARAPSWLARPRVRAEFLLAVALALGACLVAFGAVVPVASDYPLAYVVLPLAIWMAVRFERYGAVSLTVVVSAVAIWQTLHEAGPFARASVQQTLMHLQAFVAVVGISSLLLATMIAERQRLERAQRRLLRRERQARLEAQRAVAAREKALAVASHEIRNPLATVLLNSSALLEAAEPRGGDEDARAVLHAIVASAEQIDYVVRDLTDITRLEAGQISMERVPCAPASLLAQAEEMLRPLAAERGAEFRVRAAPGLPEVLAQPERIQQVIGNLVTNAFRLAPAGGRVTLRAWREEGEAEVWIGVEDSGPGMPAEQIALLLRPFWDSPLLPSTGRGLGIPIARAIVTAHGGEFRIESAPGRGCRISFSLPPAAEPGEGARYAAGGPTRRSMSGVSVEAASPTFTTNVLRGG